MSIAFSAANARAPMFRVSLILEALRARPVLMFAVAALAQGALWTLVPSLIYAAPPGEVPLVLAVGKEWQPGSPYGPPLAYWLPDLAFCFAGGIIGGVYLLPPACILLNFLVRIELGRRISGPALTSLASTLV